MLIQYIITQHIKLHVIAIKLYNLLGKLFEIYSTDADEYLTLVRYFIIVSAWRIMYDVKVYRAQ